MISVFFFFSGFVVLDPNLTPAQSGDLMPVRLSVSERKDGDKRIWTGIAQPL